MVKVTKSIDGKTLYVKSDYSPKLPKKAKDLGGKWNGDEWCFPIERSDMVKELYMNIYGMFEETPTDLVNVELTIQKRYTPHAINIAGRTVVRRRYRDSDVVLGEDCYIKSGEFLSSGGSRNNPRITQDEIVIIVIEKIPRSVVEEIETENYSIKIVGEVVDCPREKLLEERARIIKEMERLQVRLDTIDKIRTEHNF